MPHCLLVYLKKSPSTMYKYQFQELNCWLIAIANFQSYDKVSNIKPINNCIIIKSNHAFNYLNFKS